MIEKILEQLEEEREYSYANFEEYCNETDAELYAEYDDLFHRGLERAKKIVRKVAREYGENSVVKENLTSIKDDGWIPCKVEMPPMPKENPVFDNKPLELYLVTLATTEYPFRAFWNGKEFTDGWGKLSYVTAWQPLPPKYEPKDAPYQKGE